MTTRASRMAWLVYAALAFAAAPKENTVAIQMHNVHFRFADDIALEVRSLRGDLVRTKPEEPVTFDDTSSFQVDIDTAEVAITPASMTALLNSYVLAYDGAPIKDVSMEIEGNRIKQKGKLRNAFHHQRDRIGPDILFKIVLYKLLLGFVELLFGDDKDVLLFHFFANPAPNGIELFALLEYDGLDLVEYLVGRLLHVHVHLRTAAAELAHTAQRCHPYPKEFVLVVGEYAEKAKSFAKGDSRVCCFLQDARVKGKPADIARNGFSSHHLIGCFCHSSRFAQSRKAKGNGKLSNY